MRGLIPQLSGEPLATLADDPREVTVTTLADIFVFPDMIARFYEMIDAKCGRRPCRLARSISLMKGEKGRDRRRRQYCPHEWAVG